MSHQRHPEGAAIILVLGIISLVSCQLLGIVPWVMGNSYLDKCRRMGIHPEGTAVAGRICGMIAFGLLALGILIGVLILGAGLLSGAAR